MKYFKRLVWGILAFNLALLIYVIAAFEIEDVTLSKGKMESFDTGWIMMQQDKTTEEWKQIQIDRLPYLGKSEPDECVWLCNTIPREYFGKTMSFLSADKTLRVWMDGRLEYEFGVEDKRMFGNTPGSVVNFIDIPTDLTEGKIEIEMIFFSFYFQ